MLKKIGKFIFFFLVLALAAISQFSFFSALPSFYNQINLILIIVIFTLFFSGCRAAMFAALGAGFWLDIFSFNFFGFNIIILFLAASLAHWLITGWLTNRSLYSFLLLIFIVTVFYNLLVGFFIYFFTSGQNNLFLVSRQFWSALASQCFWSVSTALLVFILVSLATRRLKPFFLEKK